jgi:hypothetical protein
MVCATHRPKRAGSYAASWVIDGQVLAVQGIKANTLSQFHRSLRISESRLVCQTSTGNVRLVRGKLSLQGVARVGPCFLISSGEVGIAACCRLSVCAQMANGSKSPVLLEEELLVTDGPTPFVPGTLAAREVAEMRAFEVFVGTRSLGIVPLTDAPVAAFDSEGGFKTVPQYSWSIAAEDQLQEKLAKLLEPHGNGK